MDENHGKAIIYLGQCLTNKVGCFTVIFWIECRHPSTYRDILTSVSLLVFIDWLWTEPDMHIRVGTCAQTDALNKCVCLAGSIALYGQLALHCLEKLFSRPLYTFVLGYWMKKWAVLLSRLLYKASNRKVHYTSAVSSVAVCLPRILYMHVEVDLDGENTIQSSPCRSSF